MDLSKLRFRHVFGEVQKQKYENTLCSTMTLESCGVKGNPLYCAFAWKTAGGGALCVLDNNNPEKLASIPPMIVGHQGAILDFDFHPFNDNYIATACDDTEIRLWQIPLEFENDISTPIVQLSGHQKRVQLIQFNHTSNNILCSSSADGTVKVWNLEKAQENNLTIQLPDIATSLAWNYQGNLLGMTHKDKYMRILDPRVGQFAGKVKCHEGPKSQKFSWMGNTDYCVTTGFSKKFDRQFNVWDLRNIDKPIQTQSIDNSSGVIFPFYDYDSGLLFLAGKGDGNIRFYEFCDGQFFKCSNSFSTNKSGMAYGFYSKRSVDVLKHELMRGIKLTDSTVEFISFCAPRKAENFQSDLFPNTIGNIPAQSGEDWFMGQTKSPELISLAPQFGRKSVQSKQVEITLQNIKLQTQQSMKQNEQQIIQQEVLPNIEYLRSLQEKFQIIKDENNILRNESKGSMIHIDSLETELRELQQKKEEEIDNEQLVKQQDEIKDLEENVLQWTNLLDTKQNESRQIEIALEQTTQEHANIIQQIEELRLEIEEREKEINEKEDQRVYEELADSEEIKDQKKLFRELKEINQALTSQFNDLSKQKADKKQNQEYQQVINILLNQEDKFVNELKAFMAERHSALNVIKQNM